MVTAIIGAGNMGGAVLAGLVADGASSEPVIVVVRREEQAAHLRETYGVEVLLGAGAAEAAAARSDLVVIGVKPYGVVPLVRSIGPDLRPGAVIVSLAAGVTTTQIEEAAPDTVSVVRVMPNTPALIGQGMSVVAAGASASAEAVRAAETLMRSVGAVVTLPESQIDAAAAISGSGPAYVFYVAEALIEAGVHLGLTRADATTMVTQTLVGSAGLLAQTGEHPAVLRERVTSPGGTTAAALRVLEAGSVRAAFLDATRANRDRSRELAQGS